MAMIDAFYVFTKGGLLLWSTQLVKVKGNPLDWLIKEVLLEERMGETTAKSDAYSLKWKVVNEMELIFVAVYQGILQIAYLESLLSSVAKEFVNSIGDAFGNGLSIKHVDFDAEFGKVRQKVDKEAREAKRPQAMRSFADTKKGKEVVKSNDEKGISNAPKKKVKGGKDGEEDEDDDGDGGGAAAKGKAASKKEEEPPKDPKKGKEARHWEGGKVSKKDEAALDFSKLKEQEPDVERSKAEFLPTGDEAQEFMNDAEVASLSSGDEAEEEEAEAEAEDKTGRVGGLFKSLTRSFKNVTGGAVLTEQDLEPILASFKTNLMAKNVAADVATKLADSVRTSVVGKTTDRFTTMTSTVKKVLQESMETILTPKKSIDVLRAALAAKNAGRVYSICFLGVNGVGKSTNLAKVAYYLKNKGGLNVLICACDTFRAGAVEQLKTHSRCLDIPLFERGYGKDPADIAKNACQFARQNGHDVVLIDTAGRMQDNEPLMRALAKLVAVNNPDLVLFVGEALVGNDAIDQVTKFNRSLVDMSHDPRNPRGIDGMLLTKYDTVDDKVGAALSMVYVTGQPIVFVGCGQKYTHLRKMQAKEVVRTLLG
mmetsp:Transcript_20036/g.51226  ORF Transcript_20036/g.51226 Transcript_20036/m.51226 type:complete len:596 (-) Transcript_20036:118-1905(-)